MANITYLLGAGASANTLAPVAGFTKEIEDYTLKFLNEYEIDPLDKNLEVASWNILAPSYNLANVYDNLIKDYDRLVKILNRSTSVDTYAKKLFDSNNIPELNRIKVLLDIHYNIVQYVRGYDKRYGHLMAVIMNQELFSKKRLPPNYTVISWNYDSHFEFAVMDYFDLPDIKEAHRIIHTYPELEANLEIPLKDFILIKLNGAVNFYKNKKHQKGHNRFARNPENYSKEEDKKIIEVRRKINKRLRDYAGVIGAIDFKWEPMINFAWEKEEIALKAIKVAKERLKKTDILVVIGYSFPSFNQEIDRELFKDASPGEVIIQSKQDSLEDVKTEFMDRSGIKDDIITARSAVKQFYVP